MSDARLAIVGAGGHARCVAETAVLAGWKVVAFLVDIELPTDESAVAMPAPVLFDPDPLGRIRAEGIDNVAIAIGNCAARHRFATAALDGGLALPVLRHPSAIVSASARVEAGAFLSAGCVVQPAASIGMATIVNTSASVDHDCVLGDAVHICPGTHLAGDVRIGHRSWIGIGSCVVERRSIGADCLVGAGSVVVRDLPDGSRAWGNPARIQVARRNNP
mgnify:CR=1 FL=1